MLKRNVILLALDAFGETRGRTLLLKRLFFLGELLGEDLDYYPHYYGPYSDAVTGDLALLKDLGLIKEESNEFGMIDASGFERRRFDYALTEKGAEAVAWLKNEHAEEAEKIARAAKRITSAGEINYMDLSVAAKAYMIVKKAGRPLTHQDIICEAKKFSWNVTDPQVQNAIAFLERLDLVEVTKN